MTVSNISTTVIGQSVNLTWDMTLDYAFIIVDGVLTRKPGFQVTQDTFALSLESYVEIVDDNDPDFVPIPSQYPLMKVDINWDGSVAADISYYNVKLNGNLVSTVQHDGRTGKYTYSSARLADSILSNGSLQDHTISVIAVDKTGNQSTPSDFNFQSLNAAPPVRGITADQATSGAGKIDIDLIAPVGW